jgi:hypothetical protein
LSFQEQPDTNNQRAVPPVFLPVSVIQRKSHTFGYKIFSFDF